MISFLGAEVGRDRVNCYVAILTIQRELPHYKTWSFSLRSYHIVIWYWNELVLFPGQEHGLALTGHIPGKDFPFSDHEGVEAVFTLKRRNQVMTLPTRRALSGIVIV